MGTAVALVGAYVLAGELAAANGDPERGPAAYQRVLDPYARAALELPPGGIRGFAPRTQLMISLRARSMGWLNHWPWSAMMRRIAGRAEAITLPDYRIPANRVYR
jgi:2-polyprenyl-6-methoxyphenol hydroxylase-like FAD-dependent oxidoreductase